MVNCRIYAENEEIINLIAINRVNGNKRLVCLMLSTEKIIFSEDEKDSIGLLTSLLVRFPELCSVNYLPYVNSLNLVFILKGEINKYSLQNFSDELINSIRAYFRFERKNSPKQLLINHDYQFNLTRIIITRDIDSLLLKEISIMIDLLKTHFNNRLIVDDSAVIGEEALLLQDDYLKCLLENFQAQNLTNKIIALREEGRVLVFKQ